jgi:chemotaxis protein methyltransferase CheR
LNPFEALKKHILPELVQKRRPERQLNFWCGAASSGQESYSVLMTIAENFPEIFQWNFNFVATDLSTQVLAQAQSGLYSQLEVNRGLPDFWRDRYFDQTPGNTWTLRESVRRLVTYKRRNLQDSLAELGMFDLVLCRNVAIYFQEDFKKDLFTRIAEIIFPGGHLLLGGTETLFTHQDLLQLERIRNAIFFRRLP